MRNESTGQWVDPKRDVIARYCSDAAARNTQATSSSVPEPTASDAHRQTGSANSPENVEAAYRYRKAAEQGDAAAQFKLGGLYMNGQGVSQDDAQAAVWLRKAAEQGDEGAQLVLGDLYRDGQGVPQDYTQAAVWYRKAADQGFAVAQFNLGWLYYQGEGVPKGYSQAMAWYQKAADQGNTFAQWGLGLLYYQGQGVPQDYAEAYYWLDLAVAGNLNTAKAEDAVKERDDAASHLTPANLSRVQERARKWFEDHPTKKH